MAGAWGNGKINGAFQGPFDAQLFRRTVVIQRFNVLLKHPSERSEVDGLIEVPYADYTIWIRIVGRVSKPEVRFSSDPSLPPDKVVAVLLFGKTLDALDSEQSSSVGRTQAALADGAVSLASMYFLASTPVETVGYDPATKVFTAKLRLADGTSLNIGSDMRELSRIGIRKRLGNHWAISTYLDDPLTPLQRSLTAFLEWSKGY